MVAVDGVIIEVLFCNNASMRYIFKRRETCCLQTVVLQGASSCSQRQVLNPRTGQYEWRSLCQ
jgi:hypothetical protein